MFTTKWPAAPQALRAGVLNIPAVVEITLVLGDITEQRVNAIVNAANSSLLAGRGIRALLRCGIPGQRRRMIRVLCCQIAAARR